MNSTTIYVEGALPENEDLRRKLRDLAEATGRAIEVTDKLPEDLEAKPLDELMAELEEQRAALMAQMPGFTPAPADPAVAKHNAQVQAMLDAGPDAEGRYTDPVSGRRFPFGQKMKLNPSRAERRRLKRWRRTGKVSK